MADDKRALHAYLSPASHDAWHEFAAQHGVSVSGLLEAHGLELAPLVADEAELDEGRRQLVADARRIDAARRRRRRA